MRPQPFKMNLSTVFAIFAILLLASSPGVDAFWRLLCKGTLGTARIDPIVNFGEIAPHAHQIAGASNIGFFSDAADLQASNCTSCEIIEDKSAYWAPALYFQHDNGSFELVGTSGGMTVYYFNDNTGLVNDSNNNLVSELPITAFPPNFRMVAGNNSLRNFPYPQPDREMSFWEASDMTQAALAAKATGFNCMHYYNGMATEASMGFHYLRNKTFLDTACENGVRFEIEFPSCWDGVRLDSEDHKSHILYPSGVKTGSCPDGFNVRTPVMFFETIWNTYTFINQSGKFVIANGDTEGYGYHGDFYSGWNQTFLQNAINTCTNISGLAQDCDLFTFQNESMATSCFLNMPEELHEEASQGLLSALPGNVAISTGPGLAAKLEGTSVIGTTKERAPTALPPGSTFSQGSAGTAPSSAASLATSNAVPSAPVASMSSYASPSQASGTVSASDYPAASLATGNAAPSASVAPMSSYTSPSQASVTVSASDYAATTDAPSSDENQPLSILTTSTYSSDGHEVYLVIYEEVVTVTEIATGPSKWRAHKHAHQHANGHAHGQA